MRRKGIEWNTAAAAEPADAPQRDAPAVALPVAFDRGAATVSKASMAYVDSIAAVLSEDPSLRLVIEGHTDTTGNPRANAVLSWERAFSVFRVLVERYGIDPQRLQPLGKGDSDPLRPAEPAHAINRRVQFRMAGTLPA
jgi:outer membrane protein OmpA-like peptidoglycan-associated protein